MLPPVTVRFFVLGALPGFPTHNLMEIPGVKTTSSWAGEPWPPVQVTNAQVLNHEMVEVLGLKIWGAGWHPRRGDSKSGNNYTDVPKEVAYGITWDWSERLWTKGVPGEIVLEFGFVIFLAVVKLCSQANSFFFSKFGLNHQAETCPQNQWCVCIKPCPLFIVHILLLRHVEHM